MIPKPYIDQAGAHIPEYEDIRQGMQAVYRDIYGSDLNLDPDTQDGQLIAVLSLAMYDQNVFSLACFQSYRPDQAQGEGLSSLVKINGIRRRVPSRSTVDVVIGGQAGTIIRQGQVRDAANQLWDLPDELVIPVTGQITATARARELGAVTAPAGTVRTIATPTRGWQTANNPAAATLGSSIESDAELRVRQARSTALPALTMLEAVVAAVSDLPGVTSVSAQENDTNAVDANGLPEHSFALVVRGGDATQIARTIANKKGPGPDTAGNVAIAVQDAFGITKITRFYRPVETPISVSITIQPKPGYSTVIGQEIKQAIADHINALLDGDDVEYARLWVPANLGKLNGPYTIKSLLLARSGQTLAAADVLIPFNATASATVDSVNLIVNP